MEYFFIIPTIAFLFFGWYFFGIFWKPLNIEWESKKNKILIKKDLKGAKRGFPNGWYVLMETTNLKKNHCLDAQCCGLHLVVWRGSSGKVYVGDAFCPHMGAHLGIGGTVKDDCVECPFHGWNFSGQNGKCTFIPYTDTIPSAASIKMHFNVERNGFIYFWYHEIGDKPSWFPEEIEGIKTGQLTYRGRVIFKINTHVQDIAENFGDTNHFTKVHDPSYLRGTNLIGSNWLDKIISSKWQAEFSTSSEGSEKHIGHLKLNVHQYFIGLCFLKTNVHGIMEGPSLSRYQYEIPGGIAVNFVQATPISSPSDIKLFKSCYCTRSVPMVLSKLVFYAEAVQVARDVAIWDRKKNNKFDLLAKQDNNLKSFKNWYKQFYSQKISSEILEF